jgi:hypothetical protein
MEKYLLKLPHYQFLTKINMPGKDKRQKAKEKDNHRVARSLAE